jgi:hypothetical protein
MIFLPGLVGFSSSESESRALKDFFAFGGGLLLLLDRLPPLKILFRFPETDGLLLRLELLGVRLGKRSSYSLKIISHKYRMSDSSRKKNDKPDKSNGR